jgi:hypothetical protein
VEPHLIALASYAVLNGLGKACELTVVDGGVVHPDLRSRSVPKAHCSTPTTRASSGDRTCTKQAQRHRPSERSMQSLVLEIASLRLVRAELPGFDAAMTLVGPVTGRFLVRHR